MERYLAAKLAERLPGARRIAVVNVDDPHGRRCRTGRGGVTFGSARRPTCGAPAWSLGRRRAAIPAREVVRDGRRRAAAPRRLQRRRTRWPPRPRARRWACRSRRSPRGWPSRRRCRAAWSASPSRRRRAPRLRAHARRARARAGALRPLTAGRLIVVFGCGGDRDRGKRPLMGSIAAELADLAIVTATTRAPRIPSAIIDDDRGRHGRRCAPAASPIAGPPSRAALAAGRAGDTVLLAGKGHETYQVSARRSSRSTSARSCRASGGGLMRWSERVRAARARAAGATAGAGVLSGISTDTRTMAPGRSSWR